VNECKPLAAGAREAKEAWEAKGIKAPPLPGKDLAAALKVAAGEKQNKVEREKEEVRALEAAMMDGLRRRVEKAAAAVGRCRLIVSKPVLKARLISALETKYDEPLSKVAFNFDLRCYTAAAAEAAMDAEFAGDPFWRGGHPNPPEHAGPARAATSARALGSTPAPAPAEPRRSTSRV